MSKSLKNYKNHFNDVSLRTLREAKLLGKKVSLIEGFQAIAKDTKGVIGIHSGYISPWVFAAEKECPVVVEVRGSLRTIGIPWESLELVEDSPASLEPERKEADNE